MSCPHCEAEEQFGLWLKTCFESSLNVIIAELNSDIERIQLLGCPSNWSHAEFGTGDIITCKPLFDLPPLIQFWQ